MNWLHLASHFFGGMFLANALPHLVAGVSGSRFPTPFAKPPGKGLSSATVNVLWAFANLLAAYLLLLCVGDFTLRAAECVVPAAAGALSISLFAARFFRGLHRGDDVATRS